MEIKGIYLRRKSAQLIFIYIYIANFIYLEINVHNGLCYNGHATTVADFLTVNRDRQLRRTGGSKANKCAVVRAFVDAGLGSAGFGRNFYGIVHEGGGGGATQAVITVGCNHAHALGVGKVGIVRNFQRTEDFRFVLQNQTAVVGGYHPV